MVDIYFICGFVGAGKTTYARELAQARSGFRFTMDEWMLPLFGEHMERAVFDRRLELVEGRFRESALQLHTLGVPVIFDSGYWTRAQRRDAAQWAIVHGLSWECHYLDTRFEQCRARALARNATTDGYHYTMTPGMLEALWARFEAPAHEEVVRVHRDRR